MRKSLNSLPIIETKNMEELSTDELFSLAWSEMDKMKKNTLIKSL